MRVVGVFSAVVLLAATSVLAQDRGRAGTDLRPESGRRTAPRPQATSARSVGQANRRAVSPAPSQTRVAERNTPRRRSGSDVSLERRSERATAALDGQPIRGGGADAAGQRPGNGTPQGRGRPAQPGLRGTESPRQALQRNLNKRLSQIDKMRDRALETGNLDLLDVADRLELDARRTFDSLLERVDAREQSGQPGVGPPVQNASRRQPPRNDARVARNPPPSAQPPTTSPLPPTTDAPQQ